MQLHEIALATMLATFAGGLPTIDCDFISLSAVDEAIPSNAPWHTTIAEPTQCVFQGAAEHADEAGLRARLDITLQIMESPRQADEYAQEQHRDLDCERASLHQRVGVEARTCWLKERDGAQWAVALMHRGRLIAYAFVLAPVATAAPIDLDGVVRVMDLALGLADDDAQLRAREECPWLHVESAKMLLGDRAYRQGRTTFGGCFAASPMGRLTVEAHPASFADWIFEESDASIDCTREPLPELGEHASLSHGCAQWGRPLTSVQAVVGDSVVRYTLRPLRPLTKDDQALLIQLAKHSQAQGGASKQW